MRKLQYVFMALAVLCFAIPAFADGGSPVVNLVPIGAGIGMALAAGLCGLGQGRASARLSKHWPATPEPRPAMMMFLILGLAFIESLTLFTLVIVFLKMKSRLISGQTKRPRLLRASFCI